MASTKVRMEHDFLGDREVPADAYYGVQTLRGAENFPITATGSTPRSSARWGSWRRPPPSRTATAATST